jgi:hypothetical protein
MLIRIMALGLFLWRKFKLADFVKNIRYKILPGNPALQMFSSSGPA